MRKARSIPQEPSKQEKEVKFFELAVSVFFVIFSAFMLYIAFTTEKVNATTVVLIRAMTIPKAVLSLMLAISLYLLVRTLLWYFSRRGLHVFPEFLSLIPLKAVLSFLLVVAYVCLWNVLGFSISTFLYFACQSRLVNSKQTLSKTLLASLIFSIAVYFIFRVGFKMFLPEPLVDRFIYR